MSQPKRYTIQCFPHGFAKEDAKGSWVGYDDYAALAAENERLKGLYQLALFEWKRGCPPPLMADEINAAKEGRDAK